MNLFEKINHHILNSPDDVAIIEGENLLTYHQLGLVTNKIRKVIPEGIKVLVLLKSSVDLVPVILSLFHKKCMYIPLSEDFNDEKIDDIVETVKPDLLIFKKGLSKKFTGLSSLNKVEYSDLIKGGLDLSIVNIQKFTAANYLVFTSGTAGKPKGINGTLEGIEHFIKWQSGQFNLDKSRVAQLTAPVYDAYFRDIFLPLYTGGTICCPDSKDLIYNIKAFSNWINEKNVTVIHTVPSLFRVFPPESFKCVSHIFLAGEVLLPGDIAPWFKTKNSPVITNLYGPTETVMTKMFYVVDNDDIHLENIPVGHGIKDVRIDIVNPAGEKVQAGSIGEIIINLPFTLPGYYEGQSVGGYSIDDSGNSGYRTGDYGRVTTRGSVEFLGRKDNQVKINGRRIEAAEVESVIMSYENISETSVIFVKQNNSYDIVAFIVSKKPIDIKILKELLILKLDHIFIPKSMHQIEKLPRLISKKIDRKKLQKMYSGLMISEKSTDEHKTFLEELQKDLTESRIISVWEKCTDVKCSSMEYSFYDIGGDSLGTIKLLSGLEEQFGLRIPLNLFLENPTVKGIKEIIINKTDLTEKLIIHLSENSDQQFLPILWLLHPPGGEVVCYVKLAKKLKSNYRVYGIQSVFLDKNSKYIKIEDIAVKYCNEVLKIQPDGPFFVGGWSMGGVFAWSLVSELESRHLTVEKLYLLDTVFPYRSNVVSHKETKKESLRSLIYYAADYFQVNTVNKVVSSSFFVKLFTIIASDFCDIKLSKKEVLNDFSTELSLLEQSLEKKLQGQKIGIVACLPIKNGLQLVLLLKKWNLLPKSIKTSSLEEMIFNYSRSLNVINSYEMKNINSDIYLIKTPLKHYDRSSSDNMIKNFSKSSVFVREISTGHYELLRKSVDDVSSAISDWGIDQDG